MDCKQLIHDLFCHSMDSLKREAEPILSHVQDNSSWPLGTIEHQDESSPSDCESAVYEPNNEQTQQQLREDGLSRRHQGSNQIRGIIEEKFVSSSRSCGINVKVEAIRNRDYSSITSRGKSQSFRLYSKIMEQRRGGNANVKYAWFGATKDEILRIFEHGFDHPVFGEYGQGIYLSPISHPLESVQCSAVDEDGVKHILLCRVILGSVELIRPGTKQCRPSSEEYDSGIDDLASPKKCIIWTRDMNTHIFPEFMVSFKASSCSRGCEKVPPRPKLPTSNWLPLPTLIQALSKFLPRNHVGLIAKYHIDYQKQKITRHDMIQRIRRVAGDKLLISIIVSLGKTSKQHGEAADEAQETKPLGTYEFPGGRESSRPTQDV